MLALNDENRHAAASAAAALDVAIEQLRADSALKTWSLIITFFGDAVVPRGGVVAAATVQVLMQRFGIEAGAVRTALSRLVRDGWVVREKRGRQSYYTLSRHGAQPFESATRRIYAGIATERLAQEHQDPRQWLLLMHPAADPQWIRSLLDRVPAVSLGSGCVLIDRPELTPAEFFQSDDILVLRGSVDKVPEWVARLAGPADISLGFKRLIARFESMAYAQSCASVEPLDAMAARCLLIHEWRRVLLKSADLSSALMPADWPREQCRSFVAQMYQMLLLPSEQWLDQAGLANKKDAEHILRQRFSS